jgi:hypothetical protein
MKTVQEYLPEIGFKQRLPYHYRWESRSYTVIESGTDSYGYIIWTIENVRYQSVSYRGRIKDARDFDQIFARIKEDYDLTDQDKENL